MMCLSILERWIWASCAKVQLANQATKPPTHSMVQENGTETDHTVNPVFGPRDLSASVLPADNPASTNPSYTAGVVS